MIRLFDDCSGYDWTAYADTGATADWTEPVFTATFPGSDVLAAWIERAVTCADCGGLSLQVSDYDDTEFRTFATFSRPGDADVSYNLPPNDTTVIEAPPAGSGWTLVVQAESSTGSGPAETITVEIAKF